MSLHLFFALAEEHRQRTGHDVLDPSPPLWSGTLDCAVCYRLRLAAPELREIAREDERREKLAKLIADQPLRAIPPDLIDLAAPTEESES